MGAGASRRERTGATDSLAVVELDDATTPIERRRPSLRSDGRERQEPERAMNESLKVQPHHIERGAYLYIRQSSMRQVIENTESTKRQYALRARATALGWPDDRIIVIDCDQGESGASAAWLEGFQRLVTDVGMGRAGIVMGLEVSRLARNNADWHRLLEICALADTLILDEDGVYDPTSFNDRLLLGLKGTMSEAELHVLKARLRGGILNKVRRGEYRCVLPTGFMYNDAGDVVLDPDSQIRETIAYFFETFSRVGSAHQTVKVFRDEGLRFPSRLRNQDTTIFRPLTASTAIRTLHDPRYAGAYAYGRRRYRRTADGKKTHRKRECNDWLACIPNAHPGYITWDRFQENLRLHAGCSPTRTPNNPRTASAGAGAMETDPRTASAGPGAMETGPRTAPAGVGAMETDPRTALAGPRRHPCGPGSSPGCPEIEPRPCLGLAARTPAPPRSGRHRTRAAPSCRGPSARRAGPVRLADPHAGSPRRTEGSGHVTSRLAEIALGVQRPGQVAVTIVDVAPRRRVVRPELEARLGGRHGAAIMLERLGFGAGLGQRSGRLAQDEMQVAQSFGVLWVRFGLGLPDRERAALVPECLR